MSCTVKSVEVDIYSEKQEVGFELLPPGFMKILQIN